MLAAIRLSRRHQSQLRRDRRACLCARLSLLAKPTRQGAGDSRRGRWAHTWSPATPRRSWSIRQSRSTERLRADRLQELHDLDGAFALARCAPRNDELTLLRDPFGVRSLYYLEHRGVLVFATELKQLLALPGLEVELDHAALHKYLTFSFVPGDAVPIRGVKRLLPGQRLRVRAGGLQVEPWFALREELDPALADQQIAVRELRRLGRAAVDKRLNGEPRLGLYLSGGIDRRRSRHWLSSSGAALSAFTWTSVQPASSASRRALAEHLGIPLQWVRVQGADVLEVLRELVWKLDLPFGDAVTGPQFLLGRAAAQSGLNVVWNGEGGDQLFGGWSSKPMVAAAVYAGMFTHDRTNRRSADVRSSSLYGRGRLYRPSCGACGGRATARAGSPPTFAGQAHASSTGAPDRRRAKGSQNILPRAERIANGWARRARPAFQRIARCRILIRCRPI